MWWLSILFGLIGTPNLSFLRGNRYACKFHIPLVGSQCISLEVKNDTHALTSLTGLVKTSGLVAIGACADTGQLSFAVSTDLQRTLDRYHCSVTDPEFDVQRDTAELTLHINALHFRRRILLTRIGPN